MATPRTRLPRVSAGCFQKIPRFAPISSGFNTPYRSISQFGRTMKPVSYTHLTLPTSDLV